MKKRPTLSIIITSYHQSEVLRLSLQSIKKTVSRISYEIIVSDGETDEKTRDLIRGEFPSVRFFPHKKNVGFEKLVNKGIFEAKGVYFLIINSDIIFKNNSILELLEFFKSNKKYGLVGPKLINFDGSFQQSCFRFYSPLTIFYRRTFLGRLPFAKKHLAKFKFGKKLKSGKQFEVDWLMGSVFMTSRRVVEKVGKMNLGVFMYMEDVDWCWSMWKSDYKVIYNPRIKVYHYHGRASGNSGFFSSLFSLLSNRYTRIHVVSALKFFKKHWREPNPRENKVKN